jgi:H+/Cl- antiporter ClcA
MTTFAYVFGVAISIAIAAAIGNAWVGDHRNGVWTLRMAAVVAIVAVAFGILVGWSLQQYFAFIAASATGRM